MKPVPVSAFFDKLLAKEFLAENGFEVPRTFFVCGLNDLKANVSDPDGLWEIETRPWSVDGVWSDFYEFVAIEINHKPGHRFRVEVP